MSVINFGSSLSLKQFADSVAFCGEDTTIIGCGEPGIGKSSILKLLEKRFPGYETAYIDCTLLDLGDFALPYTVEVDGMKVTEFAPNARFKLHTGKPVIVMLDEIGKALKPVKNVLLTMINEHRVGDKKLPDGSIVFATTNLRQ
jgi:MoxR-like ATPase